MSELSKICIHSLRIMMLNDTMLCIELVLTLGLIHVNDLTPESARKTPTLLEEDNARYHLLTTSDDDASEDDEVVH